MTGIFYTQAWLIIVLLGAMVFVNGWTDAPNAVATAVASGATTMRRAVRLAAVCNFLGLIIMLWLPAAVADSVISSIPKGENTLNLICSAMIAVVAFASAASVFGIPTSESHALLAALSGAAVAKMGAAGWSGRLWWSVLAGILFTCAGGALQGFLYRKMLSQSALCDNKKVLRRLEIAAAALLSLIHGAQDGQKFSAVMTLTLSLLGKPIGGGRAVLFCAAILAAGTALGGKRIIKKVGNGITVVDEGSGVCCDAAAFISILICTVLGMPVSTTHTKTSAVLGVGIANKSFNLKTYYEIFSLWILTFPICFAVGYFITRFCG